MDPTEQALWQQWQLDCEQLRVTISPEQLAQFQAFYQALDAYNQNVNLIRFDGLQGFLNRHLLDCMALSRCIKQNATVVDIGAGGGFPTIPLVLARPDLKLIAIESVGKKCRFIEQMGTQLELGERLTVLNTRAEAANRDPLYKEKVDFVLSRAVGKLDMFLILGLPFLKLGGQLIAMKGLSYEAELKPIKPSFKKRKIVLNTVITPTHPALENARLLIFTKH